MLKSAVTKGRKDSSKRIFSMVRLSTNSSHISYDVNDSMGNAFVDCKKSFLLIMDEERIASIVDA